MKKYNNNSKVSKPGKKVLILVMIIVNCLACNSQSKFKSPADYALDAPRIISLPKEVIQISGIAYKSDSFVYAIDDDHGYLFKISLQENPAIEKWEYGKDKDYEDIVSLGNTFYTLNSNGMMISFPSSFLINERNKYELTINGKNEFESLWYDQKINSLVMLCKECEDDKKNENPTYAFNLNEKSIRETD